MNNFQLYHAENKLYYDGTTFNLTNKQIIIITV